MQLCYNTKLYVVSPYHRTGGPRSLHQFAQMAKDKGIETYIIYFEMDDFVIKEEFIYNDCNVMVTASVEDTDENIIVVPEMATYLLRKFKHIQKSIWWLSLDNYLTFKLGNLTKVILRKKGLPKLLYPVAYVEQGFQRWRSGKYKLHPITEAVELKNIYHMYNCEHVRSYLQSVGIHADRMHYLCGPIEPFFKFVDKIKIKKEAVVSFNPAKSNKRFIQLIIQEVHKTKPEIRFIAIEKMSRETVVETLSKSSVYIDFGYFPGPERMPREAVCLYCNIITSNIGSASNDEDVPIPSEFKFSDKRRNVKAISKLIIAMIENYDDYVDCFDRYRDKVYWQIDSFKTCVDEIFS